MYCLKKSGISRNATRGRDSISSSTNATPPKPLPTTKRWLSSPQPRRAGRVVGKERAMPSLPWRETGVKRTGGRGRACCSRMVGKLREICMKRLLVAAVFVRTYPTAPIRPTWVLNSGEWTCSWTTSRSPQPRSAMPGDGARSKGQQPWVLVARARDLEESGGGTLDRLPMRCGGNPRRGIWVTCPAPGGSRLRSVDDSLS